MKTTNWTDKEIAQVRELHAAGYKPREIAEVLERGPSGVACKLQKLGLHYEIVKSWTEEEIASLRDMRANHVTVREIAERLNCSKDAVEYMIKKLGLPASPRAFPSTKQKEQSLDPNVIAHHCTIAHLQDILRVHGFDKVWESVDPRTRLIKHVAVAA